MATIEIHDLGEYATLNAGTLARIDGGYRFGWIQPFGLEPPAAPTVVNYSVLYEAENIHIVDQSQVVNITNPTESVSVILEQVLLDNPDWMVA